jgi:ADP-ribosyl-[dinitrogen reductase] hydrolase
VESAETADRRAGVLVGAACADALGAGYEFSDPMPDDAPIGMVGGGPFGFAPGEWTDDTAMAIAVAEVVARGGDPTGDDFRDQVVDRWYTWADSNPPDIGAQTRAVLNHGDRTAEGLRDAAYTHFRHHPDRSAGNGALMRTAPLGLARLTERGFIQAAQGLSELTHADPVSGEACAIWTYAIHHAVVHATFDGVRSALDLLPDDRAEHWRGLLDEAESRPITDFPNNGWVVHALQAAWAAIVQTPIPDDAPSTHLQLALERAIRAGGDTDTVACIAGALLGARWGASAVPGEWTSHVHGWPGYSAADLMRLSRPDPLSRVLGEPIG